MNYVRNNLPGLLCRAALPALISGCSGQADSAIGLAVAHVGRIHDNLVTPHRVAVWVDCSCGDAAKRIVVSINL